MSQFCFEFPLPFLFVLALKMITTCNRDDDRILVSLTHSPIWNPTFTITNREEKIDRTLTSSASALPTSITSTKQNLTEEEAEAQRREEAEILSKGIQFPLRLVFFHRFPVVLAAF